MKKFDFASESETPNSQSEWWKIYTTTNTNYLDRSVTPYHDSQGNDIVHASSNDLTGYLYVLIPDNGQYFIQITLIETKQNFISNHKFPLDEAVDFIKSLNSLSPKGIERVWQAKKLGNGVTIMQNDLQITFRIDQ